MKIKRLVGGLLESNGYIVYDEAGGEAYVIDPGYHAERFEKELEALGLTVKAILLTHHHHDHVGAAEKLRKALGCPVWLHWDDCDICKVTADRALSDGELLPLGTEILKVIHTPGHTKGGVCFYNEAGKLTFTGDTIFNVDLGRTDLSDGSDAEMAASIRNIISKWTNDITIYPGHGDPATMKYVREHNREFLDLL